MAMPAAREGDSSLCPIHGLGRITPTPASGVLINDRLAATQTSMCSCTNSPTTIAGGSAAVYIGGQPAARLLDATAQGGQITSGAGNVLIGDFTAVAAARVYPGLQLDESCGVQCCEQIIHQATGVYHPHIYTLNYAIAKGLADTDGNSETTQTHNLLHDFGVDTEAFFEGGATDDANKVKNKLAEALRDKRGVIAGVDGGTLWNEPNDYGKSHAILITEGDCNEDGELTHVYLNDIGVDQQGRRLTIADILQAMCERDQQGYPYYEMVLTRDPIWDHPTPPSRAAPSPSTSRSPFS